MLEPLSSAGADLVDFGAKGNFRALGKRFGKRTPLVAAAIAAADAAALAAALDADGRATVTVDGEDVEVLPDEVIVSERPREGWSVVNEQGETVALDLELTPELVRAGLAREVVRLVQEARKNSGFDVSDRITLLWQADGDMAEALREHAASVADEVLATEMREEARGRARAARRRPRAGLLGHARLSGVRTEHRGRCPWRDTGLGASYVLLCCSGQLALVVVALVPEQGLEPLGRVVAGRQDAALAAAVESRTAAAGSSSSGGSGTRARRNGGSRPPR